MKKRSLITRSAMPDKESTAREERLSSLELTEQLIRKRAYDFYEHRGREHGHDREDWFKAEAVITGRKHPEWEASLHHSHASFLDSEGFPLSY
jgi:Protein of unknown function (DUF2934)